MIDKPRGPFRYGDRVQLTGPKGKLHTVTLREGGELHTHVGVLTHAQLIGLADGSVVENTAGHEYLALRPLLRDFVMSMPRGAAIVYPKDAAAIVQQADIFPGAVVVEAGVGSGALSLSLLRAIGEGGSLTSFERRPDFAEVASLNVETFFGELPPQWRVVEGDLAEELPAETEPGSVDRIVLDMLAPWEVMPAVADALAPGGVVICYVATATQLSRTAEFIRGLGGFTDPDASETMVRGWHVEGLAVRPDHRMVAHTGFLLTARKLAPGTIAPEAKRRASKSSYGDEDVEIWTPGAVGDREITDKNLRRRVREAQKAVDGARIAAASRRADEGHDEEPETVHPEHPADDEGEAPTRA
ncbi:tRNA (adenine-N1)-methyltransferase [Microbacterium halotolerans]|uniref:tRNA (adenine-N1)-methyltransferase n=1 Tax=Microbacterium halotolerans TaxID=246613 RepID=UPI000E6AA227|nr:tRNA (adenine-N1)-methyltransferase [Microbacterium halotolerans]